jgi:hypothetical protein
MAGSRLDLHAILIGILGTGGNAVSRVYFQPPPSIRMEYPCIIYKRSDRKDLFSNDRIYLDMKQYSITVVDKNPDSLIPDKVLDLPYCSFSTHFAVDGLNHDVYNLYY